MRSRRRRRAASATASRFSLRVEQVDGFQFLVKFDKDAFEPLRLDEPPPHGHDTAPNAARISHESSPDCLHEADQQHVPSNRLSSS